MRHLKQMVAVHAWVVHYAAPSQTGTEAGGSRSLAVRQLYTDWICCCEYGRCVQEQQVRTGEEQLLPQRWRTETKREQETDMKRELYIDGSAGLSCGRLLGALLDLGIETEGLETELLRFTGSPVKVEQTGECRSSSETEENLTLEQARQRIKTSLLEEKKKERLLWILQFAFGESKEAFGGIPLLGGQESLAQLLAVVSALAVLGISQLKLTGLTEVFGTFEGRLLPEQGVLKLLERSKLPVQFQTGEQTRNTPLGIAVAACYREQTPSMEAGYVEKTGSSHGEFPLRVVLLANAGKEEGEQSEEDKETVQVLETNVDDCTGEQLGYAVECLMRAGALDASCFPLYMKKQRPAYMLQVICRKREQELLEDIIFRETTSIGLRRYEEKRRILPRTFTEVRLKDGHKVKIKVCRHHEQKFYYPEYETVKQVCRETGRPFRSVYDEAAAIAGGYNEDI